MKGLGSLALRAFAIGAVVWIAGCASPPRLAGAVSGERTHWQGRLAVKVSNPQPKAFAANFDLQGGPAQGQLTLSTPLGTTLATMEWRPDVALLTTSGEPQRFASMQALALSATGVDIPITQLFDWFDGISTAAPGWDADLSQFSNGRISARRDGADLQAELKIVFER